MKGRGVRPTCTRDTRGWIFFFSLVTSVCNYLHVPRPPVFWSLAVCQNIDRISKLVRFQNPSSGTALRAHPLSHTWPLLLGLTSCICIVKVIKGGIVNGAVVTTWQNYKKRLVTEIRPDIRNWYYKGAPCKLGERNLWEDFSLATSLMVLGCATDNHLHPMKTLWKTRSTKIF